MEIVSFFRKKKNVVFCAFSNVKKIILVLFPIEKKICNNNTGPCAFSIAKKNNYSIWVKKYNYIYH